MPEYWVPDLNPKQLLCLNDYHRYLLLEGCKYAGKSVGAVHKVVRHLWETDRAEVAVFARTIKSAKSAGIYIEICAAVEDWIEKGGYFHGKWVRPGPQTTDGVSKVPFFTLKNLHGTISRCSLFNCQDNSDVEIALKGTRFSMAYIPEATNFPQRITFDAIKVQLRCLHLPYEAHQLLMDCNPDASGEASWLYQLFFVEKFLPPKTPGEQAFRDQLHSIHFEIADNPKIDPREFEDLKASYAHSQDLTDRYVRGLWTASHMDSHFADLFLPNIHVVGTAHGSNKDDWEIITPDESCHELIGSFDLGDVNHSAHIFQKRIVNNEVSFDVIDELVFLKEKISIEDFTFLYMEKMDLWEAYIRENYGRQRIGWRFWSDDSAFQYRSAADSYDELIVRNASEGRILLGAAHKAKGSVKLRVNLVRKLLFQKRLFFSAQLRETIRSIQGLKKGSSIADFVDRTDPLKHAFDSLTYGLIAEAPMDAQNRQRPKVERRSSVVAVGV